MALFYVLGAVVLIAVGVVGFLFYLLSKESGREQDTKAVPIANPQEFLKAESSLQEKEYKRRVEELEAELRSISEKGVSQAQQAMTMVDQLTKENDELKAERFKQTQEKAQELISLQQQTEQLGRDNSELQVQLESSQAKIASLQEEAAVIRKTMAEDLARAQENVEQLQQAKTGQITEQTLALEAAKSQIEVLRREFEELERANRELKEYNVALTVKCEAQQAAAAVSEAKSSESNDQALALDAAKNETETLRREMEEMESFNKELKETITALTQTNQALQDDVLKYRAQASGLERICENYQTQLQKKP